MDARILDIYISGAITVDARMLDVSITGEYV